MEKYAYWSIELHKAALDVTVAACKRFGAEYAELAISACGDGLRAGYSPESLISHVRFETNGNVTMTLDDINFVKALMAAGRNLNMGIGQLNFIITQQNKRKDDIDVR